MLKIDKEACIGCGICEDTCTFSAIEVVDGVAVVGDNCTLCGNCVDVCEVGALSIDKVEKKVVADLADWTGVWVYAEFRDGRVAPVAFELLGAGRKLADQLGVPLSAVLLGSGLDNNAQDLVAYGADKVYQIDDPALTHFTDDAYANVFEDLIREHKPEIVLAGATAIGRSFIPRLATMLATGLTADCTALAIREEDGALMQTRPAFGGNIMATIECSTSRPQMATVRPLVLKPNGRDDSRQGEIVKVTPDPARLLSRVKVLRSVREETNEVNINEADVLVAGGRGLDSEKGFEMIRELAGLLGGATAASRAAVDSGWVPYPHQVGQTGKTVCPKVYFACGISGAVQHMVGMQSSDTIIVINRDENAPIFDVATYGVVGDVFEVLPKLISRLQDQRAGEGDN
ncbi:MAG: electron transfer flavoprotein subunit alpha [Desulfobulbaceae bacterium]|nr:electron transfer flavoprotein subunit alpha [Desulfobulbaceae bacterium]